MRKSAWILTLYYVLPTLFFGLSVEKVLHSRSLALLQLAVGKWEVIALRAALLWLLVAFLIVWRKGLLRFPDISKKEWGALLALFLFGFFCRAFLAPRTHRLYFDEDIYLNIALNIRSSGQALDCNNGYTEFGKYLCDEPAFNKEPNAWPFLLSLALNFSRNVETAGMGFNLLLSALTLFLVFFIGKELFDGRGPLWGALIYTLMPLPIMWATTVEASTPFTFFLAASVFLALRSRKENSRLLLLLLYPVLLFTLQMRPEAVLVVPILLVTFAAERKVPFPPEKKYALLWTFFLLLLVPYAVHLLLARHDSWGSVHGPKLALGYFTGNLGANLRFFLDPFRFPLIDTFLFLVGLFGIRKNRLAAFTLVSWLVVYFGIYLFFYAGSYDYGVDARFSLPLHVPFALVAGAGAAAFCAFFSRIRGDGAAVIGGLLIFFFLFELPTIRIIGEEGWQARVDHAFISPLVSTLPSNAMIFCRTPSEVMVQGGGAIQLWRLDDPTLLRNLREQGKPLYFYFDAWCSTPEFKDECSGILKRFKLREVAQRIVRNQRFALYRILGEKR